MDIRPDNGETLQAGHRQDDRVVFTAVELGEPGVYAAADALDDKIRPQRLDLAAAAQRARPDHGTAGQQREVGPDEGISGIRTLGDGTEHQPIGILGGQILERVHRQVNLTAPQSSLELRGEQPLATDGRQWGSRMRSPRVLITTKSTGTPVRAVMV
jgi:hypothetical protein